jgi:hypothetical protein
MPRGLKFFLLGDHCDLHQALPRNDLICGISLSLIPP